MPVPDIRVTLSIQWALTGVFWLNLMSNIIRIHYFRMILGSFPAMATPKLYYSCFVINSSIGIGIVKSPGDIPILFTIFARPPLVGFHSVGLIYPTV